MSIGHAAMPPSFKENRISFDYRLEYYSSTENYDQFGEKQELPDDNSYMNILNKFDATYYFNSDLALAAGTTVSYAKSDDGVEERTNSRFTEAHAKAQYKIYLDILQIIPEGEALFAFHKIDEFEDEVLTDEGVHTFKFGSWAVLNFESPFKIYGYGGYQHRTDGRSDLMHWLAGATFKQPSFYLAAELSGYQSAADDEFAAEGDRFEREAVTDEVNAGSMRYYAVNPELTEVSIDGGYFFTPRIGMNLGVAIPISGESTAYGYNYFAGFTYHFDPIESRTDNMDKSENSENVRKFEYKLEEDYDQSLHEDDEPKKPAPKRRKKRKKKDSDI